VDHDGRKYGRSTMKRTLQGSDVHSDGFGYWELKLSAGCHISLSSLVRTVISADISFSPEVRELFEFKLSSMVSEKARACEA
jgi:hypothetical protein